RPIAPSWSMQLSMQARPCFTCGHWIKWKPGRSRAHKEANFLSFLPTCNGWDSLLTASSRRRQSREDRRWSSAKHWRGGVAVGGRTAQSSLPRSIGEAFTRFLGPGVSPRLSRVPIRAKAKAAIAGHTFCRVGSLIYIPQAPGTADRTLVWVDRNGTVQPLALPPHRYGWPRVSPDGRSLAVTNNDDGDVWCYGIARGHFSRVTFGGKTGWPIWSPDGKRLAYASKTAGHWDMFSKAADGSGPEELLMGSEHSAVPQAWSPDGQILAFIGEEVSTGL